MKPEQWIIEGEVGTSSKTIWAVMMGVITESQRCNFTYNTPQDPDDFSRCYKLLALFPEWRKRIDEVGKIFPKWQPYCREWDKLEKMYFSWLSGERNIMYDFMQILDHEAMLLDGWVETSPSSWHRDEIK